MNIKCEGYYIDHEDDISHISDTASRFLIIKNDINSSYTIGYSVAAFCYDCYQYYNDRCVPEHIKLKEIDKEEYLKLKNQIDKVNLIS